MTTEEFIAWLADPDSIRVALVEVVARIGGAETTLYLSNRNYQTAAADTPANTAYEPCVAGGVSFTETLDLDGQASISYGDLVVGNPGGLRDGWLAYVWANRAIQIYIGDPRWPRSDFRKVFDGVVSDIDSSNAESLNLKMLDKLQRLNNPITETLLGGSTANKDRLLPLTFGECFNVTPLLTNPATLEFQYHNGASESVIEVRSNGAVPVTNTPTVATGKFTLGVSQAGTAITASVQGDKPGGVYSNNISTIVQRIVTAFGPASTRFSAGDLDSASLTAFAAANTQPVGLYCTDRMNILEACQMLASSVGAQVVMTTVGLLRLVKLALPAAGTPIEITAEDIDYHSLRIAARPPVKASVKLGYCKNWTVQEALASGVTESSVPLYTQEWLSVTSTDATVAGIYKLTSEPVQEDTLLLVESDATAEALRRRTLWSTPRTVFSMACRPQLLLTELGDAVTLTHSRFGLSAGATGIVVSISRDWLKGRIELGVLV